MSTTSETATPKPSSAAPALVVFGRDEAGKAHAAWFDQSEVALAEKAADFMNMRVLRVYRPGFSGHKILLCGRPY